MTTIRRSRTGVVQKRAVAERLFGKRKRALFLDELEISCNVRRASRAAGIYKTTAYRLRRRDPLFAAAWAEALDAGCERIRAELIARALGQPGDDPEDEHPDRDDRDAPEPPPMSDEMRLKVLQVCRAAAGRRATRPHGPRGRTPEQALAALIARLERIEREEEP